MSASVKAIEAKPNFAAIARHLTDAIASGQYPVGSLLPTELTLCQQYDTSRHTVRAALAELQQSGLVTRRKNVGTRVISSKPRPGFRPSLASVDDLVQFGAEHLRQLQSIESIVVGSELAKDLGCDEGTSWLCISSVRLEGERALRPIGWTDVYVDPSYEDIAALVKASPDTLISSLIEDRYGRQIAEIQQEVRAFEIGDAAMARALQVNINSSALKVVRRYLDEQEQVFEISVSVHPADRFSISMRLHR